MSDPFASLPRWSGPLDPLPMPTGPFIADVHSFDIPPTICSCIRNAAPNCVAIVLVDRGGPEMRTAAIETAAARGMHIIWEDRVATTGQADDPDTCGVPPGRSV